MRVLMLVSILVLVLACGKALASAGIDVKVEPLIQSTTAGSTVNFTLKIENLDDYVKTVKDVKVEVPSGWNYEINPPDIVGRTIDPHGTIEAKICIFVPSTAVAKVYSHKASVTVEYQPIPGTPWWSSEDDYEFFAVSVITAIPEFVTVTIPVAIVLGTILLMKNKKRDN